MNDTVLVKKLDALEALALKLQLGLSNENYMNMYHWLGGNDGVLPSPHYLRAAMRMSAPITREVEVDGLSMSVSSLTDVINQELRDNAELRQQYIASRSVVMHHSIHVRKNPRVHRFSY